MKEDLQMYVQEEMASMHGDEEFKHAIAKQLVRKADGNFLWASLVLTEVLQCHTQDAVLEALKDVPEELEPLYERMDSTLAKSCRPDNTDMDRVLEASLEFIRLDRSSTTGVRQSRFKIHGQSCLWRICGRRQ